MRRFVTKKIATVFLMAYALVLTVAIVLAVSMGPLQKSLHLWTQVKVLEAQVQDSTEERKKLDTERNRLLEAIKNLQTDWERGQITIQTLRDLSKNPDVTQKLIEANLVIEKLSEERAVLITKLNELRQEIETQKKSAD